jgi:branched-chain amino acid transport system substrate-binding protein
MKMGMARVRGLGISILAVALAALLLVTACAPAPTAPASEKTVGVAAIEPLTGAGSSPTQLCLMGLQDYASYFDEQKTIPGVSIKLLWGDTSMQYAQFYSQYEKFVALGVPLMIAAEAGPLEGLKDRFAKDQVVMFGSIVGFQNMIYSPGWRYFQAPTLAEQFAVVAEYFMENWKEERPPKLVFVGIESQYGYDLQSEGTKYAQSLGFEVLPSETVPFVVLDATTELLRLKAEGADLVYISGLASTVGPILKDAERLGLLGQMHFAGSELGMPEGTIQMTGVASEGYLMPKVFPWFDETDVPGIKLMLDNQMKYRGKVVKDSAYPPGWIMAALACEAIKRAIENVGYENLDGAAIKQELDNMQDFDVYGLASVTYKDRPLDHRGITKVAVYEVKDGKIVPVTEWREVPSLVPPGLVRE